MTGMNQEMSQSLLILDIPVKFLKLTTLRRARLVNALQFQVDHLCLAPMYNHLRVRPKHTGLTHRSALTKWMSR